MSLPSSFTRPYATLYSIILAVFLLFTGKDERCCSLLQTHLITFHFAGLLSPVSCENAINGLEYKGAFIGKLSSYAHQVAGDVYAIDEYTFLIKDFFYDGLATGNDYSSFFSIKHF